MSQEDLKLTLEINCTRAKLIKKKKVALSGSIVQATDVHLNCAVGKPKSPSVLSQPNRWPCMCGGEWGGDG